MRLLVILLVSSCVATQPANRAAPSSNNDLGPRSAVADEGSRWSPGPGADVALTAVFASPPFGVPTAELAKASGVRLARFAGVEPLLEERHVRYDEKGRSTQTFHSVYRILKPDDALLVQNVGWAAWHQKRPVIKTRVVSEAGQENWLDAATVVEGSQASSADMLSDAKVLRAPLPGAKVGAVIETVVVIEDTEPSFAAAASGRFETWQYGLRRVRLLIEHPPSLPVVAVITGEGKLEESSANGLRRLSLDITPSPYALFTLARTSFVRRATRRLDAHSVYQGRRART